MNYGADQVLVFVHVGHAGRPAQEPASTWYLINIGAGIPGVITASSILYVHHPTWRQTLIAHNEGELVGPASFFARALVQLHVAGAACTGRAPLMTSNTRMLERICLIMVRSFSLVVDPTPAFVTNDYGLLACVTRSGVWVVATQHVGLRISPFHDRLPLRS